MDKIVRKLPVFVNGINIMANAEIFRTPEKVLIQITAEGTESQIIAEFLEQAEPIGVSFTPIPVRNITEKREYI